MEADYRDLDELIDLLEEALALVKPERPEDFPQSRFDAALDAAGHPDAPRARRIARRLGMTWGEIATLCVAHPGTIRHSLKKRLGEPEIKITDLDVIYALRLVALRLGRTTLSGVVYDRERDKLMAADRRKHFHSSGVTLPSKHSILQHTKTWDAALELAELGQPKTGRPSAPAWEVIAGAFLVHGALVTGPDYDKFKSANNIRAPHSKSVTWRQAVTEARTWLKDNRGCDVRKGAQRIAVRPNYSEPVEEWPPDFPFSYPQRNNPPYTKAELREWWYRFRRHAKRGRKLATSRSVRPA